MQASFNPQPTYTNPDERSFVRKLGRLLGRILTTLCSAVTIRIVGRDVGLNQAHDSDRETGLLRELQQEIPVAATTLLVWNTGAGGDMGANVSEFIINNLRAVASKYIFEPAQHSRTHLPSFAESVAQSFVTQISRTVIQTQDDNATNAPRFRAS